MATPPPAEPLGTTQRVDSVRTGAAPALRLGDDRFRVGGNVVSIAFSPDTDRLFVATPSAGLHVLERETGQHLEHIAVEDTYVLDMALLPGAESAIFGTVDGLRRYDFSRGEWGPVGAPEVRRVDDIDLDASTERLLVGGDGFPQIVMDLVGGSSRTPLQGSEEWTRPRFVPRTPWVAASRDDRVGLWGRSSLRREHQLPTENYGTFGVAGDGSWIAVVEDGGSDWQLHLWSLEDGRRLRSVAAESAGPIASTPDGKRVLMAGEDRISAWDADTGARVSTMEPSTFFVQTLVTSPDGRFAAAGGSNNAVDVWRIDTGERLSTNDGHRGEIIDLDFSPDGNYVYTHSLPESEVRVWSARSGEPHMRIAAEGDLMGISFDPTTRFLHVASAVYDWTFAAYDMRTGRVASTWDAELDSIVWDTRALPDGELAMIEDDHIVVRAGDAKPQWTSESLGPPSENRSASAEFSHDGSLAFLFGTDAWMTVDLTNRRTVRRRELACQNLIAAGVSRRGDVVVTGDDSATLVTWHGVVRTHSLGIGAALRSVAIAPDGKLVAYASDAGLGLWDPAKARHWRPAGRLPSQVRFSPSGDRLAVGHHDGTVEIWELADLFATAPEVPIDAGRSATEACRGPGEFAITGTPGGVAGAVGFPKPDLHEGMFKRPLPEPKPQ